MSANKRTVVEVGALAPLDAKSARVLGGGIHWTPKLVQPDNYVREEEGALPTRRPLPGSLDLTGQRFGKFFVKGLSATAKQGNTPAAWVVRCDCGAYEHRKAKALRSMPSDKLHCSHCEYLAELKAGRVPNRGPFNKAEKPPE